MKSSATVTGRTRSFTTDMIVSATAVPMWHEQLSSVLALQSPARIEFTPGSQRYELRRPKSCSNSSSRVNP